MSDKKNTAVFFAVVIMIFLAAAFGGIFLKEKFFSWIILSAAVIIIGGAFAVYDSNEDSSGETAVIAVLTALSVVGRAAFAAFPGFKPCTAVIILTGIYLGRQQGFMVGALTALVSNFYFGQGMWTPFQMIVWGMTGYIAGLLAKTLAKNKPLLIIFGAMSGAAFSLIMDLWSCIWVDNAFVLSRYLTLVGSSAVFTLIYAVSNAVFLILLIKPADRIFRRLKKKFGIGVDLQ